MPERDRCVVVPQKVREDVGERQIAQFRQPEDRTQARIAGLLVFPAVGAWLGAAAGLGLTERIGPSIAAGIAAVVIALTVYMLVLMATCRDRASEVGQLVMATARGRWTG